VVGDFAALAELGRHSRALRPHATCVNRFNRWRKDGDWDRIPKAVSKACDGDVQMTDSSFIRVHQHASNT
jgi:transposase